LENAQDRIPLEAVLCTDELAKRPSRPPQYEKENQALIGLIQAVVDAPATIFQTLADTALDLLNCESVGISLLTPDGGTRFYWPAIAGLLKTHIGEGTPREFGPCGDALALNRTLLFRHFERRYTYLQELKPAINEALLVPFYVGGAAV